MSDTTPSPAGLLAGRTVLVTGVLRPSSIATAVARTAGQQGARVLLTARPRTLPLTQAVARRLDLPDPIVPLDVADPVSLEQLTPALREMGVNAVDGVVHAVAHAAPGLLGSVLPDAGQDPGPWPGTEAVSPRNEDLERAFTVSAASLPALVAALGDLLGAGSSVVAMTFDSGHVHAGYGWMGPLKAALEASARALAVELGPFGVRVNAVSAGPLMTPAASAVPGLAEVSARWTERAPLGWDPGDAEPVARTVVTLLSDWLPATTGQVLYADSGARLLCL